MNIIQKRPLCEALFSRISAGFSVGHIVYTEDVGGSSPSSPTISINDLAQNREVTNRFGKPRCLHFVGFRGEEYWSAVKAFGRPDFIHRGWDLRAQREIADGDTIVFATGSADQAPRFKSYDDIRERK